MPLRTNCGTSEIGILPAARVTRSSGQPIDDKTTTAVSFDTETYDQGGSLHDNVTNNTRLTAPVDGVYVVNAQVFWAASVDADGNRQLFLKRDGTTRIATTTHEGSINGVVTTATAFVRLTAGQYVEAVVTQNSGSTHTVLRRSDGSTPSFSMTFLSS